MSEKKASAELIASKIKELRGSVGWSQSELARQAGVTSAAISQLEKGDRIPSLVVSRKLASALNVSVNELTGDKVPSSTDLNSKAQVFFREFGDITNLNDQDKEMIKGIVDRMKERK
ncbi:MAG: helix-turn-helix transcriptional regulator [Cycloclasticus sp.]